jgi:hypothetical protein
VTPDGARITVILAMRKAPLARFTSDVKGVHKKIDRALKDIAAELDKIPAFTNVNYGLGDHNSFQVSCSKAGPIVIAHPIVGFKYDGTRDMLWDTLHSVIEPSFNARGIRAADKTEVVEEEEIEPQGSTPVKERKKRAQERHT